MTVFIPEATFQAECPNWGTSLSSLCNTGPDKKHWQDMPGPWFKLLFSKNDGNEITRIDGDYGNVRLTTSSHGYLDEDAPTLARGGLPPCGYWRPGR
jgi:hypothetical protein